MSPEEYFQSILSSRGYSTSCHSTLQTAYYNSQPTPLQLASYDLHMIDLVRRRDIKTLRAMMQCGISLNPCNAHGESLIHTICRLGQVEILQEFLRAGCSVQVADDYGRTPMHDACWTVTPNFPLIELLLQQDTNFFQMMDARHATPLSYVRKENWSVWVEFLDAIKDRYWPMIVFRDNADHRGDETAKSSLLHLQPPNSRPIPNPSNALEPRLVAMVASGKIKPHEVEYLRRDVTLQLPRRNYDFDSIQFSGEDDGSEYDSEFESDEDEEGHGERNEEDDDSMDSSSESDDDSDLDDMSLAMSGRFSICGR